MEEDSAIKKFKQKKSKSLIVEHNPAEKTKINKSFDITSLHNNKAAKKEQHNETPKKPLKKNKKELLDLTDNNIESQVSSTPITEKHISLKSIMKNKIGEDSMECLTPDYYANKRKKRNKSVSFVLEDESSTKKSKPNVETEKIPKKKADSKGEEKIRKKERWRDKKKEKESEHPEKENIKESNSTETTEVSEDAKETKSSKKKKKLKASAENDVKSTETNNETESNSVKVDDEAEIESAARKNKKKKRKGKHNGIDEPETKTRKETEAAAIAEDLENLNIGDNPHTLTNLLDEMTVVDKKKDKKKNKKGQEKKGKNKKQNQETEPLENIEEGKEKVKWSKRKWNKDKKTDSEESLTTSVIVENLPLKIMLNYKKLLHEHFVNCGAVNGIGIAEVYPTEEPKPVFTTTVNFLEESAATKALEEDNALFAGSRIRVKRPLPPTATTLVVRSYGELTEQTVSSAFVGAGRLRSIRILQKGRKTISTAFVEFDGPQSVERATKMAADARIGGKKIHASKFENRTKTPFKSQDKEKQNGQDSDSDE